MTQLGSLLGIGVSGYSFAIAQGSLRRIFLRTRTFVSADETVSLLLTEDDPISSFEVLVSVVRTVSICRFLTRFTW